MVAALVGSACPAESPASTPPTVGDTTSEVTSDADTTGPPPEFCAGATAYMYDPLAGELLTTFPDDVWTVDDPGSLTGLKPSVLTAPWLASVPSSVRTVFEELNALDGWGTTAGVVLRFTGLVGADLPSGEAASTASDVLQLLDLGPIDGSAAGPPQRVPFELQYTDDDTTLILLPMVPLKPKHRHAAVLTTVHVAPDGDCIAPSETLQSLLSGTADDSRLERLVPRYQELLDRTGLTADDISAAVVFTTQSILEPSLAIADHIAAAPAPAWDAPAACVDGPLFRTCEGSFPASDFRGADGVLRGTEPVTDYTMPVTVYLPLTPAPAEGYPTMVFGHGLGSGRHQADELAELAAPLGFATVAIDSPHHGEHPAGVGASDLDVLMGFFGFVTVPDLGVEGLVLRDNWRQATYDKLQLLRLLEAAPDIDGDGTAELDPSRLVYLGASLGGIMGSELLALTDAFGAGILMVGGARVATIIQEAEQFEIIITIMSPPGTPDGDVQRFFPVLQTIVDAGDPANYAPHVLRDRLVPGTRAPHLLLTHADGDTIVPPGTNRALARAYGDLAHVPPVVYEVGIIPQVATAPVSGNVTDDQGNPITAALFQYDRISTSEGDVRDASHSNVPACRESFAQVEAFLNAWLDAGVPVVIDPYDALGTGPRQP